MTGQAVLGFGAYNQKYRTGREYGVVFLVGHELGHLRQPVSSMLTGTSLPREQDADCMGGAYASQVLGRTDRGRNLLVGAVSASGGGDPEHWDYHGSGEQRTEAALRGFDGGEPACLASRLF